MGAVDEEFTARRLTGSERDAAWAEMIRAWPNFAVYVRVKLWATGLLID